MLRFRLELARSVSDSQDTGTATTDIRAMAITLVATTITGVIHITERIITVAGRTTTTAVVITSIISAIITATNNMD